MCHAPQVSGYGGDILVSRLYDIQYDRLHAQITSSPRIYSAPHIFASSFTHGLWLGTLPLRLLKLSEKPMRR